jgi:secreted Zn-dependent insulinase-like peptidase
VGSSSDPYPISGLAHLGEHMTLTGSKKYPVSNYLDKLVQKYNGETNAVTRSFSTTYFFQVSKEGISDAVDVLYNSIKEPTLNSTSLERELNNIRSELSMRRFQEDNKFFFLLRELSDKKNSNIFNDGFGELLADGSPKEKERLLNTLHEFIKRNYSPNIMTLVLSGNLHQRTLLENVVALFQSLPNKYIQRPNAVTGYKPFTPDVFKNLYLLKGSSLRDTLYMNFVMPSFKKNYKVAPDSLISFYFNYYSPKSLTYILIQEDLIKSLEASYVVETFEDSVFTLTFDLTESGTKKIDLIVKKVLKFISLLKSEINNAGLYNDLKRISNISFNYRIKNSRLGLNSLANNDLEFATDMSLKLQDFPLSEALTAGTVYQEYDPKVLSDFLDNLSPSQCIFMFKSSKFQTASKKTDQVFHGEITGSLKIPDNAVLEEEIKLNDINYGVYPISKGVLDGFDDNTVDLGRQIELPKSIQGIPEDFGIISFKCSTPHQSGGPKQLASRNSDIQLKDVQAENKGSTKTKIFARKDYRGRDNEPQITPTSCLEKEVVDDNKNYYPQLISSSNKSELFLKMYRAGMKPTMAFSIQFENEKMNSILFSSEKEILGQPVKNYFLRLLLKLYLSQMVDLHLYDYLINNSEVSFEVSVENFTIFVKCFTSSASEFLNRVMNIVKAPIDQKDVLYRAKKILLDQFSNLHFTSALQQGFLILDHLLLKFKPGYTPPAEVLTLYTSFINQTTTSELQTFLTETIAESQIRFLFTGNVDSTRSTDLEKQVLSHLNLTENKPNANRTNIAALSTSLMMPMSKGHKLYRVRNQNTADGNNLYLSFFAIGMVSQRDRVLGELLSKILDTETFQYIRVEHNLGYIANAGFRRYEKVPSA